ncbi:MAG TPA: ACT domain-containing protein [Euzebyales bacterium]|nr:ACT domain-containing protein [Euzebyales bacterium]
MTAPTHLLTVLTPDQRGIIAGITALLDESDVHVLALSQTVVHDYFTVLVSVRAPDGTDVAALRDGVHGVVGDLAAVTVVPHQPGATQEMLGERYVLTATGRAVPGLVHTISSVVAARGGNFTDLTSEVRGEQISIVAEIDLPKDVALDQLQIDLQHATAHAPLQVRLQHHRLFIATNEIAFRRVSP